MQVTRPSYICISPAPYSRLPSLLIKSETERLEEEAKQAREALALTLAKLEEQKAKSAKALTLALAKYDAKLQEKLQEIERLKVEINRKNP